MDAHSRDADSAAGDAADEPAAGHRSPALDPLPLHPARPSLPPWYPRAVGFTLAAITAFLAVIWVLGRLSDLLVLLFVALFISFALEPAVTWLAARGVRRGAATLLVLLVALAGFIGFTVLFGSLLIGQISAIGANLPSYTADLIAWVNRTFHTKLSGNDLLATLHVDSEALRRYAQSAAGNIVGVSTSVLGGLFKTLTVLLFTFYLSAEGPQVRRHLTSLFPPDRQREVLRAWEIAVAKTGGYIYSRMVMAVLSGIAHSLLLWLLNVPYALALGVWVGLVSQFIPTVGTYLAGVLPVFVALAADPVDALWVLVFIVVYQQVENYLIQPRITATTVQLYPAVAFGSVIGGAALLGAVGAFLSIPVAATLQAFGTSYVRRYEVNDGETGTEAGIEPAAGEDTQPRS